MHALRFDFAPWRLSGQVIGVLLNHRPALAALGDAVHAAPYKAPPRAPVLYVKPRNTQVGDGAVVRLAADVAEVEIGASLGLVIGRTACAVDEASALDHVAGLIVVADLSVPHASFYRPSVRHKARDGFCPLGPVVVPFDGLRSVDDCAVEVALDGRVVQRTGTGDRLRPAARLVSEVSGFMTLSPGDVLTLGASAGAPRARAGQAVAIAIDGVGTLRFSLEPEAA